jgi:hypothetical protein
VIDFRIFIFISRQVFFEAIPLPHSSPPIPSLSFLCSTPCRCPSSFRSVSLPMSYPTGFCTLAHFISVLPSAAHTAQGTRATPGRF